VIGTDDNEQAKLVEKWMFEEKLISKTEISCNISPKLLKEIFPKVKESLSEKILPYLNQYLNSFGINSCEERILFFTQIAEETDNLRLLTEGKSDWASSSSKFKGRGIIQLTGSRNYENFGKYCRSLGDDVNFLESPEKINEPKYAVLSAFWFWNVNNCKKYCGALTEDNLLKVSKIINCGSINSNCAHKDKKVPCSTCKPNGWEKRQTEFNRLKNKFNCKK
jgi:putative chitinase